MICFNESIAGEHYPSLKNFSVYQRGSLEPSNLVNPSTKSLVNDVGEAGHTSSTVFAKDFQAAWRKFQGRQLQNMIPVCPQYFQPGKLFLHN